ncbi:hypothetical protein D3C81_2072800 [compost metagenome]
MLLQKRVDDEDRYRRHHNSSHLQGNGAHMLRAGAHIRTLRLNIKQDIAQNHLKRHPFRIIDIHDGIEVAVPMPDCIEQGNGC